MCRKKNRDQENFSPLFFLVVLVLLMRQVVEQSPVLVFLKKSC